MVEATCCEDNIHCCPSTLPVCDVAQGRCMPGAAAVGGAAATHSLRSVPWAEKVPAKRTGSLLSAVFTKLAAEVGLGKVQEKVEAVEPQVAVQ